MITLVVFNLLLRKKDQTGLKRNVKQSLNICSPSPNFTFFGQASKLSWFWFSDQRLNLGPCQWEGRVLTTGPPGNPSYPQIKVYVLQRYSPEYLAVTWIRNKFTRIWVIFVAVWSYSLRGCAGCWQFGSLMFRCLVLCLYFFHVLKNELDKSKKKITLEMRWKGNSS